MRMLRGCPDCGATWREPSARFCGRCGARLTEQSDTSARSLPRLSLRLPSHPARVAAGFAVAGLVVGALTWAASRPPQIQQIDVAVPGPTELQAPPDRQDEVPRCAVDGLEQDCVIWQLDARTTGTQRQGKLLVILRREGLVQALNPANGKIVWSTSTPVTEGSLFHGDVPGRILVIGSDRAELLDAGSGRTLGSYHGSLVAFSDDRFAVVSNWDHDTGRPVGPVLLVDMVSGQTEEWTLQPSEHLVAVGVPILTVVMPDDSAPTALRAYDDHGELLWSAAGESWPIAVDDVIYTSSLSAEAPRGAVLSARDPLNGQALWTYEYVQGGEFLGSPGLAHGTLVVPEADAIVALDAATGRLNWQVPSPGDQVFVEPVELPGVIVLTTWSELGTSQLVGVDVNTGEHVWTGPSLENGWWDASRITDEGLLSSTGREYSIHHYDGTVTSFELTAPFRSTNPRIVSLDPLVVSSGYRLYGLDADIALSGEPRPRASE